MQEPRNASTVRFTPLFFAGTWMQNAGNLPVFREHVIATGLKRGVRTAFICVTLRFEITARIILV